jgi:hypothetical protein
MRKSKFSEHQILAILKAVEAGRPVMKYSGQKTLATESSDSVNVVERLHTTLTSDAQLVDYEFMWTQ